ncbi:hypothetical protein C1T31_10600 [Hanstruepera neustonica]|uniref:Universal stress protein n=1 Tax=Hanstruepera neustonica TaxID=1445657 RepID=A0A2K1DX31_9FLAO|nr:hypothetical protein [Hanstruepera neustonica]PNQ72595.1 hypothetical protein C1T31_10600 [Hanstruepera neustonica]
MKKILIPTNFSRNSTVAINYVTELLKEEYCEFYFLNTYSYDVSGLNAIELLQADDAIFDEPKEESLRQLGALVEHCTLDSDNDKHSFYAISENRELINGIKTNIEKISIDLVIITGSVDTKVSKNTRAIVKKIKSCPILIVPPNASIGQKVSLTIASDFKQSINTSDISKFIKILEKTNFEISIFVLEKKKKVTVNTAKNINSLAVYLEQLLNKQIGIEYIESSYRLEEYAQSHVENIMCILDKKPDVLRKMGLYKTSAIATMGTLRKNTVLAMHQ